MPELDEFVQGVNEEFSFDPALVDTFDLGVKDFRDQEGVTYPALLLSKVLFMDCVRVLQSSKRSSYREVETWLELPSDEGYSNIGTLQLDSDALLVLRHLGICATIYYDRDNMEVLNLNDPETLMKFV